MPVRRLLTVGPSYVLAVNRRLADEIARAGAGRWEVTAVAPRFFHGDLRDLHIETSPNGAATLVPVPAHLTRSPHLFFFGRGLGEVLQARCDLIHVWQEPYVLAGAQATFFAPRQSRLCFSSLL